MESNPPIAEVILFFNSNMTDESWETQNAVSSFLHKFDIFGMNILVAYNKKYEFRTSIGGLLSIVQFTILGFIITSLI